MGFLHHIRACNTANLAGFLRFEVDGVAVGRVRPALAGELASWKHHFEFPEGSVRFVSGTNDFGERSRVFAGILETLVERGVVSHLHGEQYPATPGGREQAVMLVDRAAAPYFGLRAFGQHVNGYVRDGDEISVWVGRRARDRRNFPGKLDNMAAGGLPHGIPLRENLLKECREEAGIPAELAARAVPTGAITYNGLGVNGLKPDTLYCYDLELPRDFEPRCTDGEVEAFYLWPVARLAEVLEREGEFKLNCGLVNLDFLIRHGYIGPEHPEYLELVTGLHPPLI